MNDREIQSQIEDAKFVFEWETKHILSIKEHQLVPEGETWLRQSNIFVEYKYMTKEGKITRRIQKELMKTGSESDWFTGVFANYFVIQPDVYRFDFSQNEWEEGEFGDSGSCFFDERIEAPRLIREAGGGAIRFYKNNIGFGRAWILPEKKGMAVFNGYGLSIYKIVYLLGLYMKQSVAKLTWFNSYDPAGYIYINDNIVYGVGLSGEYDLKIRGV